jgi:hypothetical protein
MLLYNPGPGAVEFVPVYPAIGKQQLGGGLAATRHDSIASAGNKQSVLERVDTLTTLSFPFCTASDMSAWEAFLSYALTGNPFAFRPNAADDTVSYEYSLDSMDWILKFVAPGIFSVEFQCRLWVGPVPGGSADILLEDGGPIETESGGPILMESST